MGAPLLATSLVTMVISSPGFRVPAVNPKLIMLEGATSSPTQCTIFPPSSFTSSFKSTCGLVHSHAVTVPFKVTVLTS